jgi:hypothetical protein
VEHRAAPRLRAVLKAEIRYNDGLMSTPCVVREISESGARIELPGELALPDFFDLFIEKKRQTRRALLKRRAGKEVFIEFGKPDEGGTTDDSDVSERLAKLETEVVELRGRLEQIEAASAAA